MHRHTPRLTNHARQRCSEMGITTKRAKRVVLERHLSYGSDRHVNGGIVCQSLDPEISVVWDPETNMILTVLPKTQEQYVR